MNKPDPIDPQPNEVCSRKKYDLKGTPPGYFDVPAAFLDTDPTTGGERRLSATLRDPLKAALMMRDPKAGVMSLLVKSAQSFLAGNADLGNAFADLAVSGRAMYTAFAAALPTDADLAQAVGGNAAGRSAAVKSTLDRAYGVAAALRNELQARLNQRAQFKYIAVSGEDDAPHRPVNCMLPTPDGAQFAQFEIGVAVSPAPTIATRFIVATSEWMSLMPQPGAVAPRRTLAQEPDPMIPPGDKIVVYMHGHSSLAEEAGDLIPQLIPLAIARGIPLTMISLDLPNTGYSDNFDHKTVFPAASKFPDSYPCVQYIEDFFVAFVQALDAKYGNIANRVVAMVGGSLGGNMGLRLSRRPNKPTFLQKLASWSPACAWPSWAHILPYPEQKIIDDTVLKSAKGTMMDEEDAAVTNSRVDYFHNVFDVTPIPLIVPAQPQMWYRDDWEPCKDQHIYECRWGRRETYRPDFRKWHWRVAFEQMIYSFRDPDPGATQPRYMDMTSAMLLASGQADDIPGGNIFTWTRDLAGNMINTPGHGLFIKDTGHSIHNERPKLLAGAILDLLQNDFTSPQDPEGMFFGEPCTWPEQVDPQLGEFEPSKALLLHWVGPGLTDPGCGS